MMVKTFTRGKPLNMIGIRFDPAITAQLYINNLKKEIAEISYLINCPLDKQQLQQVSSLVSKVQYLSAKVDAGSSQARSYRKAALPYYNKHRIETDKAKKLHLQLKANTKMLNKLTKNPTGDFEVNEINRIIQNVESLSYEIAATKQRANNAYKVADDFVTRAKDVAEDVVTNTVARDQAKRKIASIVEKARQTEKVVQRDK
ncbi:MAG: hypothetical protein MJ223_04250 [Mycoplasmoidaceae bacterium]|nr:hypothetical protein [Mycoplasmoidaceae bacterium]